MTPRCVAASFCQYLACTLPSPRALPLLIPVFVLWLPRRFGCVQVNPCELPHEYQRGMLENLSAVQSLKHELATAADGHGVSADVVQRFEAGMQAAFIVRIGSPRLPICLFVCLWL